METWRVSTSEALRRRLNAADETPQGIMALGAFVDTFISGGGCSTELPECRPRDRKGGCFPMRFIPKNTLSWDDSTLDTMAASEESSNSQSLQYRSTSPSSRGKFQQTLSFLKRRKSEEESSFQNRIRTRSEEKSDRSTVGSEHRSVTDQEPKSIWSTDLLSSSFDQLQRSFSLQQAYGQSIFQSSTMESAENSVKPEGSTTKSRLQPLRRQSTPSPSKARYTSLTDTLQPKRSFRRNSTPKPMGKKPRLVSPDSTPKAHNSQRRSSSSSPRRSRSLWSLRQSQSQRSPRKSKCAPGEGDSFRELSSHGRSSETSRRQARQGSVVDSGNEWQCPNPQPPTSFWYFDFPNLFCGQGMAEEPSINSLNNAASATTFSPNDPDMSDLIMETSPLETAVEQTLEDIALEKKNPFKSLFRTTTGMLGKLSVENKPEGSRLETPTLQTSATHDTDLLAKASVDQSLEESKVLGSVPKDNSSVTKEGTPSKQENDQSCDPTSDQEGNEIEIDAVVEDAPVPVVNDRVGDLEQQVQDLMSRIRQMEHEIRETTYYGNVNGHDNIVTNTADNTEIQADDMQVHQRDDPELEGPDGLVEEKQHPMMSPVVPMPTGEQVSGAGNDAETTTSGSTVEDPVSDVQEASGCSTVEENRTDDDCAEDDGIEVGILDFVCKTDRITNTQDVSTIVSVEQDINQDSEREEGERNELEHELEQDNNEEEDGIEITMNDLENTLDSKNRDQVVQSSNQNNENELAESSNEEAIEKKEKNKKRHVVRGLKKKLLRMAGPRISKSRIKSTIEGQEVMPMTGFYGVQVGSEISSVSSLVSSEGQTTVKQPRSRYGMREKSCEASLATGATTLPTSNALLSFKV